jgi:hypothetical protein
MVQPCDVFASVYEVLVWRCIKTHTFSHGKNG